MMNKKSLLLLGAFFTPLGHAAPVEFDTADAHVIVIRPADAWSADTSAGEKTLNAIRAKKLFYVYADDQGKRHAGTPPLFGRVSDHPVTQGAEAKLKAMDVDFSAMPVNGWEILAPSIVAPSDMPAIMDAQRKLYAQMVIGQGNPIKLAEKVSNQKILGAALSVGATIVLGGHFGAAGGAQLGLSSGLNEDIYNAVASTSSGPILLPEHDYSRYMSVEIRKVKMTSPDRFGQVLIAYKGHRNEASANEAMIQAVVALSGIGVPPEEIELARAQDFANRKAVWDDCIARGQCHDE